MHDLDLHTNALVFLYDLAYHLNFLDITKHLITAQIEIVRHEYQRSL